MTLKYEEAYFKTRYEFEKSAREFFDYINNNHHLCNICFASRHSCCTPHSCDIRIKKFDCSHPENYNECETERLPYAKSRFKDHEYYVWVLKNVKDYKNDNLYLGCPLRIGKSIICITYSCYDMRRFFYDLALNETSLKGKRYAVKIFNILTDIHRGLEMVENKLFSSDMSLHKKYYLLGMYLKDMIKLITKFIDEYENSYYGIKLDRFGYQQKLEGPNIWDIKLKLPRTLKDSIEFDYR